MVALKFGALLLAFSSSVYGQKIIAHRGASGDAPENTLAAFHLAWKRNADGIEGDFFLTKDGEIVCIHDATTKRTAAGRIDLKVAQSTLAELRKLDVGSWKAAKFAGERIPTLREVLKTVPRRKEIFIEVKCGPEIVPVLKRQLATNTSVKPEQISIIAFKESVIAECRREMPHLKANWLVSFNKDKKTGKWGPTTDSVFATLRLLGKCGLGTRAEPKVVDTRFAQRLRNAGHAFHCWTVNDVSLAKTFRDLGVASITTDFPAVIRQALKKKPAPAPVPAGAR